MKEYITFDRQLHVKRWHQTILPNEQ